jgi:hypothetical protein
MDIVMIHLAFSKSLIYNLPYSAGSLSSSTQDLLTWMTALHQAKILSAASYESMITPGQLNDGSKLQYAKALRII